jgi:crotonobetainyl-CoA:carnitine CoA-transferase CaiB-like acyl-CoA transferase
MFDLSNETAPSIDKPSSIWQRFLPMSQDAMSEELPLSGIRVFEFGCNLAGPYAGWILASLGAEVIKIERPEGDDARTWGPPFWKGAATVFHAVNRDKKSLVVDLKDAQSAARLRQRIQKEADIVLQNLRAGAVDALGFSADCLMKDNPRLIYCNVHAFGARGPLKHLPGYDTLMQAFGGVMSVTGEEGQAPVRAGVSAIDCGTGMWCVIGVLAALHRRTISGQGCMIDASLFETALGLMNLHSASYQATGDLPARMGTATRSIVPYQGYQCSDGVLIIAASNDRLFAKLARVLGHEEWIQDERFRSNPQRVAHRAEMNRLLEGILITAPRAEWQQKFEAAGVPSAPVQSIAECLAHPQTAALEMAQDTGEPIKEGGVDGAGKSTMKLLGLPISLNGRRPPLRNLAPPLAPDSNE